MGKLRPTAKRYWKQNLEGGNRGRWEGAKAPSSPFSMSLDPNPSGASKRGYTAPPLLWLLFIDLSSQEKRAKIAMAQSSLADHTNSGQTHRRWLITRKVPAP